MKHSLSALLCLTALTACSQTSGFTGTAEDFFKTMEGPEITGVDETMLNYARDAEKNHDYKVAAQTYQQLLDKSPDNKGVAYALAEALRKNGDLDRALNLYNSIEKQHPDYQEAREGKGLTLLAKGGMDEAGLVFSSLMEENPNRWRTLNGIGILFAQKNLYPEAQQYFKEALAKSPDNPSILNNSGLARALDRDFYQAIRTLEEASAKAGNDSQRIRIDLNTALVHAVSGNMQAAEIVASKHLQDERLQNNLGLYAELANDQTLAKTHLHMALSESKTHYERAWQNLQALNNPPMQENGRKNRPKRLVIPPAPKAPAAAKPLPPISPVKPPVKPPVQPAPLNIAPPPPPASPVNTPAADTSPKAEQPQPVVIENTPAPALINTPPEPALEEKTADGGKDDINSILNAVKDVFEPHPSTADTPADISTDTTTNTEAAEDPTKAVKTEDSGDGDGEKTAENPTTEEATAEMEEPTEDTEDTTGNNTSPRVNFNLESKVGAEREETPGATTPDTDNQGDVKSGFESFGKWIKGITTEKE